MELLWQLNEVIPLKGFEQCRVHNDLGTLLLLLLFLLLEDSQKESGGNKLSVAQKIHSLTYSLHIVHITYKPEEAESSGTASQWDRQAARPRPGNTHGFAGRSSCAAAVGAALLIQAADPTPWLCRCHTQGLGAPL